MVWLSVMTPQNAARAKNAGILMACSAATPPSAPCSAPSSFEPSSSEPKGASPLSAGLFLTTSSVKGRVPTSMIAPNTR